MNVTSILAAQTTNQAPSARQELQAIHTPRSIEASFEGGFYYTSSTYGNSAGMSQLNDRRLEYSEIRVGTGADYGVTKDIHVGLDAGAVVYREFDFQNSGFSPKVDPAPYVQLGAKVAF
jgi:hypothetical protein